MQVNLPNPYTQYNQRKLVSKQGEFQISLNMPETSSFQHEFNNVLEPIKVQE